MVRPRPAPVKALGRCAMSRWSLASKGIPVGMFALVLACFALPFLAVSCGPFSMQRSGIQMGVTGQAAVEVDTGNLDLENLAEEQLDREELENLEQFLPGAGEVIDRLGEDLEAFTNNLADNTSYQGIEPLATVALLGALVGLGFSFLPPPRGPSGALAASLLGGASLLALRFSVASDVVAPEVAGLVEVRWLWGYWAALALFGLAALWATALLIRREPAPAPETPATDPAGEPG